MARTLSAEQKKKMQEGRAAAAANETPTSTGAIPVFKPAGVKASRKPVAKIRLTKISIGTLAEAINRAISDAKAAGLNPVSVAGSLRLY